MKSEDNIDTSQAKIRKLDSGRQDSIVVFLVLPVILTLFIPTGIILYIYGRLSWHPGLVMMFSLFTGIGMVVCIFAGIVRLIRRWKRCNWKVRFVCIVEVGVPIVFVVLFMIPFFVPEESKFRFANKAFTYGYRDRIESKVDIPTIRVWLKTLNTEEYAEPGDLVPQDKWPESLEVLCPKKFYVLVDKNGDLQARFTWGGAIFHWGLTIGMEDFKIPPSELDDHYESWLLVEPGVYVYDW